MYTDVKCKSELAYMYSISLTWPAAMQIYWNKRNRNISKEFNSHWIGLGHQHGRRLIVLG